jgi:hypothetical protein
MTERSASTTYRRDFLFLLFLVSITVGSLLQVCWIVLGWLGIIPVSKSTIEVSAQFGLYMALLVSAWGLWLGKKWAAVMLLIVLISGGLSAHWVMSLYPWNIASSLFDIAFTIFICVGSWWLFVGRLWLKFN